MCQHVYYDRSSPNSTSEKLKTVPQGIQVTVGRPSLIIQLLTITSQININPVSNINMIGFHNTSETLLIYV